MYSWILSPNTINSLQPADDSYYSVRSSTSECSTQSGYIPAMPLKFRSLYHTLLEEQHVPLAVILT